MTGDPLQGTGTVRDRIDELHRAVFKEDFYPKIGIFGRYMAEQKRAELLKAEKTTRRTRSRHAAAVARRNSELKL